MFADSIPLAAHQKAADYTVAKAKLGIVDTLTRLSFSRSRLAALCSGCRSLAARVLPVDSLWHGAALILSVLLIKGALGLPLSLYRIFVIEERFGFNRMTWKLFVIDFVKGLAVGTVLGVPLLLAVLWLMLAAGRSGGSMSGSCSWSTRFSCR